MIFRSLIVLVLIGVLWLTGVVNLDSLPWDSTEFRISGSTVLLYLIWSAWESRYRGGSPSLPYAVFYAVLLISALDGFLLEITTFRSPWLLRWSGLVIFAAGSALRITAYRIGSVTALRSGRYAQLAGLPLALGSIAGLVVALAAGVPGSVNEELGQQIEEDAD